VVLNVRLIYEQIEAAKSYLLDGSLLGCRLALILLDNAAELMMHRELEDQFAQDDTWRPQWEPARTEWLQSELGPKYTPDQRQAAEREFEPKTRILCIELRRISDGERHILNVCHKLRCEAFHRGVLRHQILDHISRVLYLTVVELTLKLPFRNFILPGSTPTPEEADFLARFNIDYATSLASDESRRQMAECLSVGVILDPASLLAALSDDLVERIDEVVQGLETVGQTKDRDRIDRNLQHTQFWREIGAKLMEEGLRGPDLEATYLQWQEEGRAKYTLHKIDQWRRQAEAIRRFKTAAAALVSYWAVDKRLHPLEDDVFEAVFRYEEDIDARIHSR
jgi:hypothetical protein